MSKEETVFDEAEMVEDMPEEEVGPEEEEEYSMEEFNVVIPSESPKEKLEKHGVKINCDGRTLTIKEIGHTKPKTKDFAGNKVAPKKTQDGTKEFYPGKLKISFVEDNVVEYYPNFHYFLNDKGVINPVAKINRTGNSAVTKLFNMAVTLMGKPADEVSDQDFYDFLVGKKVEIKTATGVFNSKPFFRNDIETFVD